MFKKLRIKFIAITMIMIAVVMALSFTTVCAVEYQRSLSVVETALSNAIDEAVFSSQRSKERGMRFMQRSDTAQRPDVVQDPGAAQDPSAAQQPDTAQNPREGFTENDFEAQTAPQDESLTPPNIGNRPGQIRDQQSIVPIAVYRLADDGSCEVVPAATSASISDDVLQEAQELAADEPNGFALLEPVGLYVDKKADNGTTYLAFADTSYTDGWRSLAFMLALVGVGTLIVFFVISLFYSRWALRPVREAWDSQRQFIADASHDLKTPLTVILANAAILLKHPERSIASESQWIESTQIEAENMQGLVNEMLELAQVEVGQEKDLVRACVDLSDLVDGETLLFDSIALERNCSFNCEIEAGITVVGDEKQLKKMVATLVENAFKYVDEQGSVRVSARKTGKQATIAVHNTGSSITPDDLPHIFDRFYRTDKARTSGAGGFGLGLAIAREIARQHNGDITCASSETAGTTFTITLPAS